MKQSITAPSNKAGTMTNIPAEFTIRMTGNSMLPKIPPGALLSMKRFNMSGNNPNSLPFGQIFGVEVEDQAGEHHGIITILRRHKAPEMACKYWIAHSPNSDYDDFDIAISQVRALYIVNSYSVIDYY